MTSTNYQQQAIDFLASTQTEMKAEFLEYGYHFEDDKQKRNIFRITLSNSNNRYHFKFGTSIRDSVKNVEDVLYETEIDFYYGLKFEGLKKQFLSVSAKININEFKTIGSILQAVAFVKRSKALNAEKVYNEFKEGNLNKYIKHLNILRLDEFIENIAFKLFHKAQELKAKNWGEGIPNEIPIAPTAYDVLASIEKYEVTTFEDFCSNYGYDIDSRKAYKTYKAVKREWENVKKLFSEEQLELLREIQ